MVQSMISSRQVQPDTLWSPLALAAFRAIWIASVVSNVGSWMQNVGVAWQMTTLTPSPVLVALIQTATSLPVFLVGLPAGTLADLVDRRRLLLVSHNGQQHRNTVAGSLLQPSNRLAHKLAPGLGIGGFERVV